MAKGDITYSVFKALHSLGQPSKLRDIIRNVNKIIEQEKLTCSASSTSATLQRFCSTSKIYKNGFADLFTENGQFWNIKDNIPEETLHNVFSDDQYNGIFNNAPLTGETLKDKEDDDEKQKIVKPENTDNNNIEFPINQILYGAPGTGKTYSTVIKAMEIIDNKRYDDIDEEKYGDLRAKFKELKENGQIEFVTFHQSMAYEDFIEGIKPVTNDNGEIQYKTKDGIFKVIADRASKDNDKKYILIIDEINRGNISKIFGELITLIEKPKRIGNKEAISSKLPYSQKTFGVPNNLYIIGTMNTSDRSIAAVDIALRRRFQFIPMRPEARLVKDIAPIKLNSIFKYINKKIEIILDEDHMIGHGYFMKCKNISALKDVWFNEIMPLINEYFYGDWEKIRSVLGKDFILEIPTDDMPADFIRDLNGEKFYKFAKITDFSDEKFITAMNALLA